MTIYQVDSFTKRPFAGNPAGVCVVAQFPDAERMQNIASEMNLSETAFAVPDGPAGRYQLRWFTPAVEVDLCGHATLATAHILWEREDLDTAQTITFETLSGELKVSCSADGLIQMDFPAERPAEIEPPPGLLQALGADPVFVGGNRMDIVVELRDEAAVRTIRPNLSLLEEIDVRGVMVTAAADMDADFVSRFFAPRSGVAEDPVTGSAHCCLGPYWATKFGKSILVGFQASRRGGFVHVQVKGDRVLLSGYAVTVMKAELQVD